ncbi:uncharacterized protein LOC129599260 [Paramacrobiotus metropolitanus]|uniref:uncharacterized protein LOC129599260 n=1 Tax=Paramacrobiotus metropolitanus TaxID=2943436 RepID=UPI002445BB66|nr:uncharacterized protein LOC129599260 [Paramacrobiotus metropolitanus]
MPLQNRRKGDEDSTDDSDDDCVPSEHMEVEEEGSECGEADLEPSSGGDTNLDVGKRKRKRKICVKANSRGKKKSKYGDDLDNNDNDETTSNETRVCMPKKPTTAIAVHSFKAPASRVSSDKEYSQSSPSPNLNDSSSNRGSAMDDKNGSGRVSSTSRDSTTSVVAPSSSQNASSSKAPSGPLTGLGSVFAKLSGKKKMSTLDKSQFDWKKYKNDHCLDEDLAQFNKGKGGYLDRKEFLERTNLREYEYDQNVKSSGSRRSTMSQFRARFGINDPASPRIMVFRPTWDEFRDFPSFIHSIESECSAHLGGVAKIIPPKEWRPHPAKFPSVHNLLIPKPIQQRVQQTGHTGAFLFNLKQESPFKLALDYLELEEYFWRHIPNYDPIYGADVPGSLFDSSVEEWNISRLPNLLELLPQKYQGANTPYLYFGMWRAFFGWHTEDMDLYSINFIHRGDDKFWYGVSPAARDVFEAAAARLFKKDAALCPSFLRHKRCLIKPSVLKQEKIRYDTVIQSEGEIIITFPGGYHAGFNCGLNVAESTNFATSRWIKFGEAAKFCTCSPNAIHFPMDPFRKYHSVDCSNEVLTNSDILSGGFAPVTAGMDSNACDLLPPVNLDTIDLPPPLHIDLDFNADLPPPLPADLDFDADLPPPLPAGLSIF